MKCAYHPDKDAIAVCVACGTGICADCRDVVRGASYCEDCRKTHEPPSVFPGKVGRGLNLWAVISWVMVMMGLWPGLEYIAIGGLILGFVALGDIRAHGYTQAGSAYAYAAIGIAIGSLAAKYGLFFYYLRQGIEFSPWLDPFRALS